MTDAASVGLLSLGLAADAAAVAAAVGASGGRGLVRACVVFGVVQAAMAGLGAAGGSVLSGWLGPWQGVLSLVVLGGLGARAAWGAWSADPDSAPEPLLDSLPALGLAAVATSLDALAAGGLLPFFALPVVASLASIGGVTTAACLVAGWVGQRAGQRFGRSVQLAGGVALAGLGVALFVSSLLGS